MSPRAVSHPTEHSHPEPHPGGAAGGDRADGGPDWRRAARWGGRLAPPGPTASRGDLEELVARLRASASRAVPLAARAGRFGTLVAGYPRARVLVVDRPGWAQAAADSFSGLAGDLDPALAGGGGAWSRPVGTAQVAGLLALLSGRVLGQFDPFGTAEPGGRLLLVAPNLLHVERAMSADPGDLALWVCVHEQTHAMQFAAAPWLAEHLRAALAGVLARRDDDAPVERPTPVRTGARAAAALRSLRGVAPQDDLGLLGLALDPDQRREVEQIGAVMSLLEGHADVTMDAVPSRLITSRNQLRARLDARRRATGVDAVLRRLIGLDAKLLQYRRGADFVRGVRRAGGRTALEAVWSGPSALPTPAELLDPASWVHRVHG